MKLSLCTSVKGRLGHLRQTLPFNIGMTVAFPKIDFEFCVCDYGGDEKLTTWLGMFPFVRIRTVSEKPYYLQSNAKNCSHKIATGDYIMNVDADNFVSPEYMEAVLSYIEAGYDIISHKNKPFVPGQNGFMQEQALEGQAGRITVRKSLFYSLGGYDEDFVGWGNDDSDFIFRAEKLCAKSKSISPNYLLYKPSVICHGDSERLLNQEDKDKEGALRVNIAIAKEKYKNGVFIANQGKQWGQ